jgi:3'(2'), 5'-bisphosphate nucleotidase
VAELTQAAAAAILSHYHSETPATSEIKADSTPVTAADLAAHDILVDGLARFDLPVLSEESAEHAGHRRAWETFWMVDPLDGTREFLERTGEFSINIALIEAHRATFGLIAIPGTGEVFCGGPGLGAWRLAAGAWQAMHCRSLPEAGPLVVLTSRRHRGEKLAHLLSGLSDLVPDVRQVHCGSAIKFCRLADGSADFYPRFSPCSEWDTAAGQALLEGAGGAVLSVNGSPLRYNARDILLSPKFYALADPGHPLWSKVL